MQNIRLCGTFWLRLAGDPGHLGPGDKETLREPQIEEVVARIVVPGPPARREWR